MSAPILELILTQQAMCGRLVRISRMLDIENFESSKIRDYILVDTYLKMRLDLNHALNIADSDDTCPHDK